MELKERRKEGRKLKERKGVEGRKERMELMEGRQLKE
jgi:hypothetical protein